MKKILSILLLLMISSVHGGVLLFNDSPYLLTAEIHAANGVFLNHININAGEQTNWTQNLSPTQLYVPGQPDVSITPYRVVWKCQNGGYYSVCDNVSPGSLVKPSQCPGAYYCKPKDQKEPCPPCICPGALLPTGEQPQEETEENQ